MVENHSLISSKALRNPPKVRQGPGKACLEQALQCRPIPFSLMMDPATCCWRVGSPLSLLQKMHHGRWSFSLHQSFWNKKIETSSKLKLKFKLKLNL